MNEIEKEIKKMSTGTLLQIVNQHGLYALLTGNMISLSISVTLEMDSDVGISYLFFGS